MSNYDLDHLVGLCKAEHGVLHSNPCEKPKTLSSKNTVWENVHVYSSMGWINGYIKEFGGYHVYFSWMGKWYRTPLFIVDPPIPHGRGCHQNPQVKLKS